VIVSKRVSKRGEEVLEGGNRVVRIEPIDEIPISPC